MSFQISYHPFTLASHLGPDGKVPPSLRFRKMRVPEPPALIRRPARSCLKMAARPSTLLCMQSVFKGPVYVVRDNIDTDQIIPAEFLNLIPTIPDEYEKLGSYAMWGLPNSQYPTR